MSQQHLYRRFTLLVLAALLAGWMPAAPVAAVAIDKAPIAARAADGAALRPPTQVVPPITFPRQPGLVLGITVSPDPVEVGETANITVTLDNRTPTAADKLVITLPTPDGALALPGPGQLTPTQGWRWNVDSLAGVSSLVLTGTLRMNRMPASGALLLHPQAAASNVPRPVEAFGGVMVLDRSLGASTTPFNPGTGAILRSRDGRIRVDVPARAATRALTLRHDRTPLAGARVPRAVFAGGRRGIGNFFLDATDAQGAAVRQFAEPITITVSYTPEQLQVLGFNEATLSVYWFDETENAWVALPTQIDSEAHTARAQVNHFSTYNLSDGSSPSAAFIPSLQGFQVGAYTGAATYSIPIDVPAGAGGLKPSINLGYSSAASDGSAGTRTAWQAGWAGKGWDIDAGGYVAVNTNAGILNSNIHTWDTYTLVFGGRSFDVVKGQLLPGFTDYQDLNITHWAWNAIDENFTRVRVDHDGAGQLQWHAWTKDGTRYDFTQRLWQRQGDTGTPEIYKWLLTQVIDTHQNKIAYTYNVDVLSTTGVDLHPTYYLHYSALHK